ncbi:Geraniol 8-hydroxylase [Vitis vinifera]|uniref:Geraniol 8-hydroxylase n=1 Tax=Vitis vinifera TaxID=29760 RepID=A0A438IWL5_VITVI|nr:Geraniol 8-hydroxylase [Vitis vinifera]
MDYITVLLLLSFVWTCIHLLKLSPTGRKPSTASLPPGPRPFPIIGNILKLGDKPHQSLTNLSKTYGPVMSLKLGSVSTIVISSSETAKEVLHRNDQAFSGRVVLDAVKGHNHHESSVVWSPASAYWRKIRKICTREMFSVQRLEASQGLRRKIVQELLDHAEECCGRGCAVDIGAATFTASLNLLSNTIFSINLAHHGSTFSQEFKDIVWRVMEDAGRPNFADYFPAFKLIDPQGSSASNDVLDAFLNLTEENNQECFPLMGSNTKSLSLMQLAMVHASHEHLPFKEIFNLGLPFSSSQEITNGCLLGVQKLTKCWQFQKILPSSHLPEARKG